MDRILGEMKIFGILRVVPGGVHLTTSQSHTILLTEDDARVLTLYSATLRQEGFHVLTATNAQAALQVCKEYPDPIHLLLTDLLLPNTGEISLQTDRFQRRRKNGLDLMREVETLRPEIKVMLMSGHSDEALQALGVFREHRMLLRKPIRLETLVQTVQQILELPRAM